jgi:5-methylthioribose kinase
MSQYRVLDAAGVSDWLAADPGLCDHLGGAPASWRVRDVADGNLNSVFLVDGLSGGVCVKQALPYVRVAGESWPLDVDRARYEAAYFARVAPFVGRVAPEIYRFDPELRAIAMEKLEPHIILRKGLIAGDRYARVASEVAEYVAQTSVHTSDLAAPFEARAIDLSLFAENVALQRISVDLIFLDPFAISERNKILPALDPWAAALRDDLDLKAAIAGFRIAYLTKAQSLLHGDLHSGSIMVTPEETKVIDGEFAWVGPSGFDVGNFIAHLVMAWFAKPFHGGDARSIAAYREALEADIVEFWSRFRARFLEIAASAVASGEALPASHFNRPGGAARLGALLAAYVDDILRDAVGFLALKMIRRIVGFAQVADFLVIADETAQATAKARALGFARSLLLEPQAYRDPRDLVGALRRFDTAGLTPDNRV